MEDMKKEFMKTLGNNIRTYREQKGLSQEELAEKVGVTRQTIISIESGKYTASLVLAIKIARVFQRRVEDIFILEEEGEDIFAPDGPQFSFSDDDRRDAQRVADALQSCVDTADGNSVIFTNELQGILKDTPLPKKRSR